MFALLESESPLLSEGPEGIVEITEAKLCYGAHLESVRKYPFECKPLGLGYLTVSDLTGLAITR